MFIPILKTSLFAAALTLAASSAQASTLLGSGVPTPAFDKAVELSDQGHDVRKVVFIPGGGWVVLFDLNGFYAQGAPQDAFDKLNQVAASGLQLKTISFTAQRGWVILFGKNEAAWNGIPQSLVQRIQQAYSEGTEVNDILVTSTGAWVFFGTGGYAYFQGIHQSLADKIVEFNRAGTGMKGVAVSPLDESDWLILLENNGYWYNNLEQKFIDKLQELYNDGYPLKSFTYANGGQGLLIW